MQDNYYDNYENELIGYCSCCLCPVYEDDAYYINKGTIVCADCMYMAENEGWE